MVRGAIALIRTIFVVMIAIFLVGTVVLQPLIQEAEDGNSASDINQPDLFDNLTTIVFQGVPLAMIGGVAVVAVALIFGREGVLRALGGGRRRR